MIYKHGCNRCIYLGESNDSDHKIVDVYWCINSEHRPLDSIIARYGDIDSEYMSTHPPEAFTFDKEQYKFYVEYHNWYKFALETAKEKGLYNGKF